MGALFGKAKPPKVVRMPDANDPNILQSEERKRREIAARSGRSSTMLSRGAGGVPRGSGGGGNGRGGGGGGDAGTRSYSNSLLGSAG